MSCSILVRVAASGRRPRAPWTLSTRLRGWVVPGIATVMAGCETLYLRKNWPPALAVEFGGPVGQRAVADAAKEAGTAEGQVGDDGDLALDRGGEHAVLHPPVVDRVIDLDEVERLVAHVALKLGVLVIR